MKFYFLIILLIFSTLSFAKLSSEEHSKLKKECEESGYKYSKSKGKCSTKLTSKEHKKRKEECKKKGQNYDRKKGSCDGFSKEQRKKFKKSCEEKGFAYVKSENACSVVKKSKKHKECLKYNGKWVFDEATEKGACQGAVTKAERKCTKKGGTYNKQTKKCSGKVSSSKIRKVKKACEKKGFEYNPDTNQCSELLTQAKKDCDAKNEGTFVNGKCKVNAKSVEIIKETCKKLGWKYDRKTNECSTKKKTRDRVQCDKRYKTVDGVKVRADFKDGVCSISKSEMKENIVQIKKDCASKGLKYDRLTFGCHEWKKTSKGKKDEKRQLKEESLNPTDGSTPNTSHLSKKEIRQLNKSKKQDCRLRGFDYDKFKGECDETKPLKVRVACIERSGVYENGECTGGLSKKEFAKKEKSEKKEKRINDKAFRKELMEEAKITFKECVEGSTTRDRKKQCRLDFRTDKRLIRAKFGNDLFRTKEFQSCLDNALKEETNTELPEGVDGKQVTRALVTKCYKARNRKIIKSAIIGLAATGSFFLLPGGGAAALGMIVGNIGMMKLNKSLTQIEDQVIEHVKSYALQEGRRLTQKTIDKVITEVRKEYYQQLGIEPSEENLDGIRTDRRLTKKEERRLNKIEKRAGRHWKETSLRIAKENYRLCQRSGELTKDQCKYVLKKTQAGIKSKIRSKIFTSEFLNNCLDEAGEDEAKAALCFKQRRDSTIKTALLVLGTGGALLLSPEKMREYLNNRLKRVNKKISDDVIKQIEKETLDIIVSDAMEGLEIVGQPQLEEGMNMFKFELIATCKKLNMDCENLKIETLGAKDRLEFFKTMKKTALEQAEDKFQACVNSPNFTQKQCKLLKRMDERFIKAKYNNGFMRGKKFNACLDKVDEEYKNPDKQATVEHKLAINQCFKERNKRRIKYTVITLAAVGAVAGAYALNIGQVQKYVGDFISSQIQSQLKSKGAEYEEGEGVNDQDIGEYAFEISGKQAEVYYKKASRYVTGSATPTEFLAKMEIGLIATVKAIEHENGIPVYNKTLEEVIEAARKEFFEQIGKVDGELLTRTEKKGLRNHVKDTVNELKSNEVKEIGEAYDLCLANLAVRKSKCKEMRKIDLRMVKAKYNSRFLNSKTFRSCLDKAFEITDEDKKKLATNQCFVDRKKRTVLKLIVVGTIAAAVAISWNIKDQGVSEWVDKYVVTKANKMYGEELKTYLEKKHLDLTTQMYIEATSQGLTPIEKTKLFTKLNQVWEEQLLNRGQIGQFYVEQEKSYRDEFNKTNK